MAVRRKTRSARFSLYSEGLAKTYTIFLLVVFVILFAISFLYWLTNVDQILLMFGLATYLHDSMNAILAVAHLEFLREWSKDRSSITPFIACFVMFYSARSCSGMLFRPERAQSNAGFSKGNYPFPANYKVTLVQLGLIGTLWGFLLIGERLQVRNPAESVLALTTAFETALLSTFSGVLASFVVGPLISRNIQWLLKVRGLGVKTLPNLIGEINDTLSDLQSSAHAASNALFVRGTRPVAVEPGLENEKASVAHGDMTPLATSVHVTAKALSELQDKVTQLDFSHPVKSITNEVSKVIKQIHQESLDVLREELEGEVARSLTELLVVLNNVNKEMTVSNRSISERVTRAFVSEMKYQLRIHAKNQGSFIKSVEKLAKAVLHQGDKQLQEKTDTAILSIEGKTQEAIKALEDRCVDIESNLGEMMEERLGAMEREIAVLRNQPRKRAKGFPFWTNR